MGLMDKITEGVNKGIGETERVLEVGKLKTQRSSLQKSRDELLLTAGRTAFAIHRRTPFDQPELEAVFESVRNVELQIVQIDDRLAQVERGTTGAGCPSCGAPTPAGAAFCVACGKPIEKVESIVCSHCGTQAPEGSAFCVRCGAGFDDTAAQEGEGTGD